MATDMTRPKTIYTRLDQREEAVALLDAAVALAATGGTLVTIDNEETAKVAGEYRAQAQKLIKELDTERLEMTAGARATVEQINGKFNEQIDALRAKEKAIGKAILAYMDRIEAEARKIREAAEREHREKVRQIEADARAAQERVEAEAAEQGKAAPPPPEIELPTLAPVVEQNPFKIHGSHGSVTGARDNWKYRVVDINAVPPHLLIPPEERIAKSIANATVKSLIKGRLAQESDQAAAARATYRDVIPGLEIYNEPHLASRVV